ncbi:Alpha/beta hydrolase family [Novymonas esmeraldas]|uniref:Alpha/beta hydrolase family n=1 Tax=Novymonas esmeraldas TaxID=1808958 RepID=A0AAW0EW10_9TRYP
MSGLLRTLLGKAPAPATAMRITETPVPISYALASFRWHMDTRAPTKVIAVHDYLGSGASWQQLLHESVADLPLSRLTPTEPLEVYCADLRGHGFSEDAPVTPAAVYPLACAADIIKVQQDILRSEAALLGLGFGSLVAATAALHAPDAFSSLTLFVQEPAQLQRCVPSAHPLLDILRSAPAEAADVAALNTYLTERVPHPAERAALLATAEVRRGRARFRVSKSLLEYAEPLELSAPTDSKFTKPTVVYVYGKEAQCTPAEEAALRARFPALKLLKMDMQGESLMSAKLPLAPLFLQAHNMLGEINEAAVAQ